MTIILRVVLILASIFTTTMMMRKIRQSKVQIEDSIFWMFFSGILILFSIFPGIADILSDIVGTYSTSNFIFLFIIFLLLVKTFSMTLRLSQLETRLRELAQQMALDAYKKEKECGKVQGEPFYEEDKN